jgi:hypothetical protein
LGRSFRGLLTAVVGSGAAVTIAADARQAADVWNPLTTGRPPWNVLAHMRSFVIIDGRAG